MNSLKFVLSQFKQTFMLLAEYPYIQGENFLDYDKQATWNRLNTYMDLPRKSLIYEYPGYRVQTIIRFQPQC